MFGFAKSFNQPLNNWNIIYVSNERNVSNVSNVKNMYSIFENTTIGNMLKNHNLTNADYFDKNVYHELFVWPRKKDYVTFLVNNQYLPLNTHQEEHEYHPLFDNPDMSKYIAYYL
jgi:hypothetical protein